MRPGVTLSTCEQPSICGPTYIAWRFRLHAMNTGLSARRSTSSSRLFWCRSKFRHSRGTRSPACRRSLSDESRLTRTSANWRTTSDSDSSRRQRPHRVDGHRSHSSLSRQGVVFRAVRSIVCHHTDHSAGPAAAPHPSLGIGGHCRRTHDADDRRRSTRFLAGRLAVRLRDLARSCRPPAGHRLVPCATRSSSPRSHCHLRLGLCREPW